MIARPYNEQTVKWSAEEVASWEEINDYHGNLCVISNAIDEGQGNEVNHVKASVSWTGEGAVRVAWGYYTSDNRDGMLSKSYYMRGPVTVPSPGEEVTLPACPYKGYECAWVMVYADPEVEIENVTVKYWAGYDTLYGHRPQDYEFLFRDTDGTPKSWPLRFRILYPKNMDDSKKYPVVVSGSGSGGVGDNNVTQMEMVILGRYLFTQYYQDPELECISIVPQIPRTVTSPFYGLGPLGRYEQPFHPDWPAVNEHGFWASATINLVTDLMSDPTNCIDRTRIYFGGFSYGGKAIYELLKQGRRWCAGAIGCAGWPIGRAYSNPDNPYDPDGSAILLRRLQQEVARYRHISTIIAAGENDSMRYGSQAVYNELVSQGADTELQIYPGASHVSSAGRCWSQRANMTKMFSWRRQRVPRDPYPRRRNGSQYPPLET